MKRALYVGLLVVCGLVAWFGSRWEVADGKIDVELVCAGDRCEASFDGYRSLEAKITSSRFAERVGLYIYHPWERDAHTRFRDFVFERHSSGLDAYQLSLTELDHAGWFDDLGDSRWVLTEGKGLEHRGEQDSRSVAMFAPPTERDFRLQLTLEDAVDAGILFRANSEETGWLLIVRHGYNDAFFAHM